MTHDRSLENDDEAFAKAKAEILGIARRTDPDTLKRALRVSEVDRYASASRPAAAQACKTCPWENPGLEHPDNWFDGPSLAACWNTIRVGRAFRCHATYMPEPFVTESAAAAGWSPTPEHAETRECAGSLTLLRREYELRQRLGSAEAYFNVRGPYGASEVAFIAWEARLQGRVWPAISDVEADVEVSWIPWPVADGEVAAILPPCDCPVCTHHAEAHPQATITTADGREISVDAAVAPLVENIWMRGGVTIASCQNFAEAIDQLWPAKRSMLANGPDEMNYKTIDAERLAFVRGLDTLLWEPLAEAVEAMDGEVTRWGPAVQIAFPLAEIDRLMAVL